MAKGGNNKGNSGNSGKGGKSASQKAAAGARVNIHKVIARGK